MKTALALLFALVVVDQARAQTAQPTPAADITNTEIQAAVRKTAALPVSDQQLRMVSIKGEYNVGAAVVHRAKTAGQELGGALAHSQITEVYYIISGMRRTGPQPQDAHRPQYRRNKNPKWKEPPSRAWRHGDHSSGHAAHFHRNHH